MPVVSSDSLDPSLSPKGGSVLKKYVYLLEFKGRDECNWNLEGTRIINLKTLINAYLFKSVPSLSSYQAVFLCFSSPPAETAW